MFGIENSNYVHDVRHFLELRCDSWEMLEVYQWTDLWQSFWRSVFGYVT